MTYEELSEEQQFALEAFLLYRGLEVTKEGLEVLAKTFDELVKTTLIVGEVSGVIGGITTSEFVKFTRIELTNKMLDQALSMAYAYDQNLMKVNYTQKASPLCIHRQNKVYWVTTPVGNYEQLQPEIWDYSGGVATGGLFHPNCYHQLYAYFPGESDPVNENPLPDEVIAENYRLAQEANYIKRTKQKYYRQKQIAKGTDNGSYDNYNNLHKKWVDKEKQFKKDNDL